MSNITIKKIRCESGDAVRFGKFAVVSATCGEIRSKVFEKEIRMDRVACEYYQKIDAEK